MQKPRFEQSQPAPEEPGEIRIGPGEEGGFFTQFVPPIPLEWLTTALIDKFHVREVEPPDFVKKGVIGAIIYGAGKAIPDAETIEEYVRCCREAARALPVPRTLRGPVSWLAKMTLGKTEDRNSSEEPKHKV